MVTRVLCHCDPIRPELNLSRKKLEWIAARYAAITFPLFYLLDAFLDGLNGNWWVANLV